jgi:hypothetical protein
MLTACVSTPADPAATPEDPPEPEASAVSEDPEYARELATYKNKKRQCDELGTLIEKTESGEAIVGVNDAKQLAAISAERRLHTDKIAALNIDIADLATLRGRYVVLSNDIASAISEAAAPVQDKIKKDALKRYRELDTKVRPLLDEINTLCNA